MRRSLVKPVVLAAIFLAGVTCGSVSAQARLTHMQIALADLQAARYHLNLAPMDNGGHRGSAISMLDGAIEQVRLGIDSR